MIDYIKKGRKGFGIPNLTLILIFGYAIGYVLQLTQTSILQYLTLDPYQIIHNGQIWRLVTWLFVPPSSFDFFTLIMLYFYYKIGTLLEQIWGTVKYTRYILGGIVLTLVAGFVMYIWLRYVNGYTGANLEYASALNSLYGFSTYYINLSIFVGYAATFPDMRVLFFFIIPLKVKVLGIIDVLLLAYMFITTPLLGVKFAIGAALLNIGIFLLTSKVAIDPKQIKRRQAFNKEVKTAVKMHAATRHKCAVCGRTDETNPELEFRYCSKCNGNYEYCQDHLFTHEHVK